MTLNRADAALCLARLGLAAALLPAGVARALNVSGFALTVAATGMPAPNAVATALVVANLFGPLALILGIVPRLTGLGLAAFALLTTFLLHRFWDLPVGALRVGEAALFQAGLGLSGGFLLYAAAGPGGWSWQGLWHGGGRPASRAEAKGPAKASKTTRDAPRKAQAGRLPKAA